MRFEVFAAVKIQVEVFWVVVGYQHLRSLKLEAAWPSETLVSYHNPEDLHWNSLRHGVETVP
jgi:hypothetical protein